MKLLFLLTTGFVLHCQPGGAQVLKNLSYEVEGGSGVSVGRNTSAEIRSDKNPFTLYYSKHKRYRFPSLSVRGTAYLPLSPVFHAGIRSGMNVHYMELYYNGQPGNELSFPLLAVNRMRLMEMKGNKNLYAGGGFGYHLYRKRSAIFNEKGGLIASGEIAVQTTTSASNKFFYKLGFEYAQNRASYHFVPGHPLQVEEDVHYLQHRKVIYVTIGGAF